MISGYNHNIDYADKVFHVQTEDSGPASFTITTEIFIGGNIIKSQKQIYCESQENCPPDKELRALMQDQHKSLMKQLVNGEFDSLIAERGKYSEQLDGPAPINIESNQNSASTTISAESKEAGNISETKEISKEEQASIDVLKNPRNPPNITEESLRDTVLRYLREQD